MWQLMRFICRMSSRASLKHQETSSRCSRMGKSTFSSSTLAAGVFCSSWVKISQSRSKRALRLWNICASLTCSSWTKLSTKSGPRFNKMKAQLQDPHLQILRRQFEPLRHALVTWLLQETRDETPNEFVGEFDNLPFGSEQPVLQSSDAFSLPDTPQSSYVLDFCELGTYTSYADDAFLNIPHSSPPGYR